ncbi:uncharacterized protein [Ptychodera flava]|uniref:uncharacterized protein n=1 Tax=Ptychodera flava TaxID=63121 RepID=UPI003969F30F
MGSKFQRWLAGFSSYKRSFNLGVLSGDDEVKNIYEAAEDVGKLPFNRSKVMFLGDARVGKTSLRRLLMGEQFQIDEPSTEGIDTRMCTAKEVDYSWKESKSQHGNDFEIGASWYTAKTAIESSPKQTREPPSPPKTPKVKTSKRSLTFREWVNQTLSDNQYMSISFVIPLILSAVLYGATLPFGFVFLEWTMFIAVVMCNGDFLSAYRYGTSLAIMMAVDIHFRCSVTPNAILNNLDNLCFHWPLANYLAFCFAFTFFGFILGIFFGYGCRAGIAFGLCLLASPGQLTSLDQLQLSNLSADLMSTLEAAISIVGDLAGICIYRYFDVITSNHLWILPRRIIGVISFFFLVSVFLSVSATNMPIVLPFILGMLLWSGKLTGEFLGRDLDKKFGSGYFLKKFVGVMVGLLLGYGMGWKLHSPTLKTVLILIFTASVLTHPVIELYVFWKVRTQRFPIINVRDAMKEQSAGSSRLATRLSLWDFAGDQLYHATHQIFIASHAVYLLVFNFERAAKNRKEQFQRLLFWLNSIRTHAKHEDAVIFLVGTHRDSVSASVRYELSSYFHENLYDYFCDRLVMNDDGTPVFPIENSKPLDIDARKLRNCISEKSQEAEYMKAEFPLKYLHFYELIKSKRKTASKFGLEYAICGYREVHEFAKENCKICDSLEFELMLGFFHKAGEIIFHAEEEILNNFIIFDPQVLVDIVKNLINIPPFHKRYHRVAPFWRMMEKNGIADSRLVSHIVEPMKVSKEMAVSLLQAYDLMCLIPHESPVDNQLYLVPGLLPLYMATEKDMDWWLLKGDKDVYYIDFCGFLPEGVFSRLLARCFRVGVTPSHVTTRNVYYNVGKFLFDKDLNYKLELVNDSPQQPLVKVTVQRTSCTKTWKFLKWFLFQLEAIRQRDFKYMKYICGVLCPNEDHNCLLQPGPRHIVKLASEENALPLPNELMALQCEGRRFAFDGFCEKSKDENIHQTPCRISMHTRISELPPSLYKQICNSMNIVQPLQGDWRDLAGELQHTQHEVQILRNVDNPCDALLQQWSCHSGVTVKQFIEVLLGPNLGRQDVVTLIKEAMGERKDID